MQERRCCDSSGHLLRLVILLVVGAQLSACGVPSSSTKTEKHYFAYTQIKLLEEGLEGFFKDCGRYPSPQEGLRVLSEKMGDDRCWKGPYIQRKIELDPWGTPYIYNLPAKYGDKAFDLYSAGRNKWDDQGRGDDISNWRGFNKFDYANANGLLALAVAIALAVLLTAIWIGRRAKKGSKSLNG